MKFPLILIFFLLSSCALPQKADLSPLPLASGQLKLRYDLMRGKIDTALASSLKSASPGVEIPISITLTNRDDRSVWIPVTYSSFFQFVCRRTDGKMGHTVLGGGPPNDLVYARELKPGQSMSESVSFVVPEVPRGALEILLGNAPPLQILVL